MGASKYGFKLPSELFWQWLKHLRVGRFPGREV